MVEDKKAEAAAAEATPAALDEQEEYYQPSVTRPLFLYWILPVVILAIFSRFAIYDGPAVRPPPPSKPVTLNYDEMRKENKMKAPVPPPAQGKSKSSPSSTPTMLSSKPPTYQELVKGIAKRRLDWSSIDDYEQGQKITSPAKAPSVKPSRPHDDSSSPRPTSQELVQEKREQDGGPPPRGGSADPIRKKFLGNIDRLRDEHREDTENVYKAVALADALRMYDIQYHDGGTFQEEAIETYRKIIQQSVNKREQMLSNEEETNRSLSGMVDVNEEIIMEYTARSIDGFLCALYSALGKTYFMANMFEKAVESYSSCLDLDAYYLDAVSSRGSTRIILGLYEDAAQDFMTVIERDHKRRFQDVFTGLGRVLQAKEDAVPGGWEPMIQKLDEMIPLLDSQYETMEHPEGKSAIATTLNRFYHVMFLYHDVKTKNIDAAWDSLWKSYEYKMSVLPPWNAGFEQQKISATKQIFHRGFWPQGVGSQKKVPIFIIGFVRSGSTLLERVLDAHPQIVGTGENSVFNGQLDEIRNKIVESSMLGDPAKLASVISSLADGVVDEMRERWQMVTSGENLAEGLPNAERFVDKMLTNYYNVGFIHMLFPNALILHVAREPMDTIFSAFKHEFPSGPLDYTSAFSSLAEFYHGYRDLMEHWDRELPGRVTHVRYEDMVHDMPGVARKIIEATGLEWDDGVLDFHKKKHAVNTLSTTQVRKGVYKSSLQSWRKYEEHLKPLVDLIGDRTTYDLRTTLPGYVAPEINEGTSTDSNEENNADEAAEVAPPADEESTITDEL